MSKKIRFKCVYKFILCKNHAQEGFSTSVQITCYPNQLNSLYTNFKHKNFKGFIGAFHSDVSNTPNPLHLID
jgi:hypothetical protein